MMDLCYVNFILIFKTAKKKKINPIIPTSIKSVPFF